MRLLTKSDALAFVAERAHLLDDPGNPTNPFSTSEWFLHFIEQVATKDWTIVAPEARTEGLAVMLLYQRTGSTTHCSALANYYAPLFSPLLGTHSGRTEAMTELVRQLTELRPRRSTLNFAPLDGQGADTSHLVKSLGKNGWYVRRYRCFGNWYLPCAGMAFDAYMQARDPQLRNTLKRKSKKLFARGRIELTTDGSGVEAAMDAYEAVYAKSWKQPEPYPRFVREWARICARRGWLRLGVATVDGSPIAVQFWIAYNSHAYIFKLAYDEEESRWSAGTVLTAHMIRHALEVDRVVEIDYLNGDEEYKQSWMTHRRERVGLMACNLRSPQGLWAAIREFGGQSRARIRNRVASDPARQHAAPRPS